MELERADVDRMSRYCVVCGKEWGPQMKICCSENSLVAIRRDGFLRRKSHYFNLDGVPLHEEDLARLRRSEMAAASESKHSVSLRADLSVGTPQEARDHPHQADHSYRQYLRVVLPGRLTVVLEFWAV